MWLVFCVFFLRRLPCLVQLVMDSKLLEAHEDDELDSLLSPDSGPVRALIAQQRRGLECVVAVVVAVVVT